MACEIEIIAQLPYLYFFARIIRNQKLQNKLKYID